MRAGQEIHVGSTTVPDDDGLAVGPDDPSERTRHALELVASALEAADGTLADQV